MVVAAQPFEPGPDHHQIAVLSAEADRVAVLLAEVSRHRQRSAAGFQPMG
jgi:hypothetical protein